MKRLEILKKLVFESNDNACFIERERILQRLASEMTDEAAEDRYALIFKTLLGEVSTPIDPHDIFAGRVVEALPDEGMHAPSRLICSIGHLSPDYQKILTVGLKGILAEIEQTAREKGDRRSLSFCENARIVIGAIKSYADRYSLAAKQAGRDEMAKALAVVPFEPAYDLYSALQSVWLIHMIASCYVGARDYAFGRFDRYVYPYYRSELEKGRSEAELTELLAGFLIKTNEICGRSTHNHRCKPVPCHASKQYLNIGGEEPNALSLAVLKAAKRNCMAQPEIVVLLKPDADEAFTNAVFDALAVLTDKMNVYHYDLVVNALLAKGVDETVARDFTYSACCTFDLHHHSIRAEYYTPVPQIFLSVLYAKEYESVGELRDAFRDALQNDIQKYVSMTQQGFGDDVLRKFYVLDSLLLSDCASACKYAGDGTAKYMVCNIFCPGIATVGDSLMVIDKLVFAEKRLGYTELLGILQNDYSEHGDLLDEIKGYTMFGNDTPNDAYTVMAANAFQDAVDAVEHNQNVYLAPGFYSLEKDNLWCAEIGATPNGRRAGTPFSENQSPTYGSDKNGITALLGSLAKLPFDRTVTGGLNLTFSQKMRAEILRALVLSYFELGGLHVGISVIDRKALEDAMIHPDRYQSLTVRLYGFSEYFVSLPKWQQLAVLNRTEYSG